MVPAPDTNQPLPFSRIVQASTSPSHWLKEQPCLPSGGSRVLSAAWAGEHRDPTPCQMGPASQPQLQLQLASMTILLPAGDGLNSCPCFGHADECSLAPVGRFHGFIPCSDLLACRSCPALGEIRDTFPVLASWCLDRCVQGPALHWEGPDYHPQLRPARLETLLFVGRDPVQPFAQASRHGNTTADQKGPGPWL